MTTEINNLPDKAFPVIDIKCSPNWGEEWMNTEHQQRDGNLLEVLNRSPRADEQDNSMEKDKRGVHQQTR